MCPCLLQGGLLNACLGLAWKDGCAGATMDILDNPLTFDLTLDSGYALAANAILRLRPGGVVVIALCCESFSIMSLASIG